MESEDQFFICLYKDKEKSHQYIGHATSNKNEFPEDIKNKTEDEEQDDSEITDQRYQDYLEVFEGFANSMLGFLDVLPFIASLSHSISQNVSNKTILAFASRHGNQVHEDERRQIFAIPNHKYTDFDRVSQQRNNTRHLGSQITRMMILGVVSSFEHHLSQLIKTILIGRPEILNSKNIEVTLKEIGLFESIDQLRSHYTEAQVESVMRESFDKQIETVEKYLGIKRPIKEDYDDWDKLIEIFERRNLFAHADGRVNKIYLSKVKGSDKEVGQALGVSSSYFSNSIENLFEFGIKLITVAWRKECSENVKLIDSEFALFCYTLMEANYYRLAARLLEFANTTRVTDDRQLKMNIINLANCYRMQGNKKKAEQVINAVDWGATGDEFKICVASVTNDLEGVIELLATVPTNKVAPEDYEKWSAFYRMRDEPAFADAFQKRFDRQFLPDSEDRRSFKELMSLVRESEHPPSEASGDTDRQVN